MEQDINKLPHEDGTTVEVTEAEDPKDLEKEKEEAAKEFNNAIEEAEEVVDDINTAEAKPFKEKLILPETDDSVLVEELEEAISNEPHEFTEVDFVNDLLLNIKDLAASNPGLEEYTQTYVTPDGGRYKDGEYDKLIRKAAFEIYSIIKPYAKTIEESVEDKTDEPEITTEGCEETLDEAVPKDLLTPFKLARVTDRGSEDPNINQFRSSKFNGYKGFTADQSADDGRAYHRLDFNKSEYTEITPEEAKELKRNGEADKVLAILDGQLVAFNKDGKQLYRANKSWGSDRSKYTRPNGDVMPHSGKLTFGTVVDHAEKIYKSEEVLVPDEVLIQRRSNPESKAYRTNSMVTTNISGQDFGLTGRISNKNGPRWYSKSEDIAYYRDEIRTYQERIASAKEKINDPNTDPEVVDSLTTMLPGLEDTLKEYKAKLAKTLNIDKDRKARLRYYNSELDLRQSFIRLKQIKDDLAQLQFEASKAETEVAKVKTFGAQSTRDNKERLNKLLEELKGLNRRITEVEILLDGCEEDDAEALAEAQEKLNVIEEKKNEKAAELKALLNHNKSESLEESLLNEDADIPALTKIKKAGKEKELNKLMSDLYPEGITEDQLNDILTYEQDYILDTLGIAGDDNE